ncbi:MAG: AEC family transporter [archaeon]|nr:AEC family transporter [archaeon]
MSSKDFSEGTSRMLTNIILPCYIFTQMMNNLRLSEFTKIFHCLIGCLIVIVIGAILGLISGKCLSNNKKEFLFLTAAFSSSDSTAFLIILAQVCGPFLDAIQPPKVGELPAGQRALYYVVLITILNNFWKWTFCYYMIKIGDKNKEGVEKDYQQLTEMQNLGNKEENKEPDYIGLEEEEKLITNKETQVQPIKKDDKPHYEVKEGLLNIPIIVMLITLVIVFIPPLQTLFTTKDTFLNLTIISVNVLVGKSYNFLCMFLLGLFVCESLHLGGEKERPYQNQFLSLTDIIWLTSLKLILMPLLTIPVLILIFHYTIEVDIVLFYLIFILSASPIDINMNVICGYKINFIETCSILCSAMFVVSLLTYIVQSTLIIYVLNYFNPTEVPPVIPQTPTVPI